MSTAADPGVLDTAGTAADPSATTLEHSVNSTVTVDLDRPGATISRHLYGHFAEHLGRCIYDGFWVGEDSPVPNEGGIRLDVVEALRALDIPNLRWPGGCFADRYHWTNGIGPREERPGLINTQWGGVAEDNSFGTHEFMALCELLGADAYISGNIGSGTVQEMADWAEYLTGAGKSPMADLRRSHGREEPWTVRFWGLGNETWGCGGNMRAGAYADLARQFGTFVQSGNDTPLYRVAAGADGADTHWTQTLMEVIPEIEGHPFSSVPWESVSVHYYTIGGSWHAKGSATDFDADTYWSTIVAAQGIEELLRSHAAVMDVHDPEKKYGMVLDEWGTWWDVEPGTHPGFLFQQNTIRDAMVAAWHFDVFHGFADRLTMANIAQTVNVLQAMLLTDPDGGEMVRTPTYHVFEMNKGHHDATVLPTTVAGPTHAVDGREIPVASASASTKDGRVLVSLTNVDLEEPLEVSLDFRGGTVTGATGRLLTADRPDAHNRPGAADEVSPVALEGIETTATGLRVTLPPHSFATVTLELS
ncbi:alpha-L-arabinofuranosidase C-terminal domain-containing protein [Rathayibacter sp. AY1D2]|uniref:alpha-N-arabinofuranosidase n=1 Tax=Rathayibacter sp. AY1D2 TaxID=2080543 RepID=UPI0028006FE3|nr:alpha-L-arabinofuranosidase C-terminal domain-containing protein [Rathayibacter sp. AY1D2]